MARTRETRRPSNVAPQPAANDNDDDDLLHSDPEENENESKEENFSHGLNNNNEPNIDAAMHEDTRAKTIAMYQRVLTFRLAAATALYDD